MSQFGLCSFLTKVLINIMKCLAKNGQDAHLKNIIKFSSRTLPLLMRGQVSHGLCEDKCHTAYARIRVTRYSKFTTQKSLILPFIWVFAVGI